MFQQNSISEGQIIEAKHPQYSNRQFKILKFLGKGGEGEVFQAQPMNWIENIGLVVALKFELQHTDSTFIEDIIQYQRDYENSPFGTASVIVMEAGSVDLYSYLQSDPQYIDNKKILLQLTISIRFLHHNNLIHRNLKPEKYVKVDDKFKLIDFGLIRPIYQRFQTLQIGTPLFQAPEVADGHQNYSTPADIWSLGCVFFEVLTKQSLFQSTSAQQQLEFLRSHCSNPQSIYDKVDKLIPEQFFQKLIKEMIHPIPEKRINIEVIYQQINSYTQQQGNDLKFQPNFIFNDNKIAPFQIIPKQFPYQQIPQQGQFNEKPPYQFKNIPFIDKNDKMISELKSLEEKIEKQFQEKLQNQSNFIIECISKVILNQQQIQSPDLQSKLESINKTVSDLSVKFQKQEKSYQNLFEIYQQKLQEINLKQINNYNQQQDSQLSIQSQLSEIKQLEEQQQTSLKNYQYDQYKQLHQTCNEVKQQQAELKQQLLQFQQKHKEEQQWHKLTLEEYVKGNKLNEIQQQLQSIQQQVKLMVDNQIRIDKQSLNEYSNKIKNQINQAFDGLSNEIENENDGGSKILLLEIKQQLNQQEFLSQNNQKKLISELLSSFSNYLKQELHFDQIFSQQDAQNQTELIRKVHSLQQQILQVFQIKDTLRGKEVKEIEQSLINFKRDFDKFYQELEGVFKILNEDKEDIIKKVQNFQADKQNEQNILIFLQKILIENKINNSTIRSAQFDAKQHLQRLSKYVYDAKENLEKIKNSFIDEVALEEFEQNFQSESNKFYQF